MGFNKINTKDQNLGFIQGNIESALIPIQRSALVGGNILKNISIKSGQDNLFYHNLGRFPSFAMAMIPNVNATIWSPTTSTLNGSNWDSKQINIRCSADCTVSIWVN